MNVKLLTEHHLEFYVLKQAAQDCLSPNLSKCHIVGNHVTGLIFTLKKYVYVVLYIHAALFQDIDNILRIQFYNSSLPQRLYLF